MTWARCAEFLAPALDQGWTLERAKAEVDAGRAWLWPGSMSAALSEIVAPKTFHIWAAGGAMSELLEMEKSAEIHARDQGCERMTIIGRKGWERVMAPAGYRVLLVKELHNGR